mmetsp:Transcript_10396/g.17143  ORF Transcript_10396/g.17143 Transcript_10396/m.17143 type:complete len:267 (-) Transcript_10396:2495-3295(-)
MMLARIAKWQRATPLSKAELITGCTPRLDDQAAISRHFSTPCKDGFNIMAAMGIVRPSSSSSVKTPSVSDSSTAKGMQLLVFRQRSLQESTRREVKGACTGSSKYSMISNALELKAPMKAAASSMVHAWLASRRSPACGPTFISNDSASWLTRRASSNGFLPTLTFTIAAPSFDPHRSSARATSELMPTSEEQLQCRGPSAELMSGSEAARLSKWSSAISNVLRTDGRSLSPKGQCSLSQLPMEPSSFARCLGIGGGFADQTSITI